MSVIPALSLAEAEAHLADAKVQLDAEAERSFDGKPAYLKAEDAWMAARLSLDAVRSQQPQRGRAFSEEFAL